MVRNSEEDLAVVECFEKSNLNCTIIPACTLVSVLEQALRAFFEVLDRHTLADLLVHQAQLARLLHDASAPP